MNRRRLWILVRESFAVAMMIVGILAARSSLADHYHVPSGSMEYTLQAGDRVVVDKRAFGWRVPFTQWQLLPGEPVRRGDVIIFDSPVDGTRLIKRAVAVAGDRVLMLDGKLWINGRAQAIDASHERSGDKIVELNLLSGNGPAIDTVVPTGAVLAIGDHRGNSRDSRYFGWVDEVSVYGLAIAVYYRSGEGFTWREL